MISRLRGFGAVVCVVSVAFTGCKGGGGDDGGSQTSPASVISSSSGNAPPTVGGNPVTATNTNAAYSFVPTASDGDGDKVSFQIENKPAWASFDATTGELAGTPSTAQAGKYADIVISASDGKHTVSLPAFAIEVNANVAASVQLSWSAPVKNVDGSALTDLSGYIIAYGEQKNALSRTVHIENASIDRYVITDLAVGKWFFGLKAVRGDGTESALSQVVSKTIK